MKAFRFGASCAVAALLAWSGTASVAQTQVKLEKVVSGINTPLAMVQPPGDNRMFIVEQNGRIKILEGGKLRDTPFLDVRSKIKALHHDFDERGLLGLAFHPKFKDNGKFYVSYSAHLDYGADLGQMLWYDHSNVVEEYTVLDERPERGRPEQRAAHPVAPVAAVQPQRPLDRLRSRRHAVRVDGRRRLRQRLGHRPQRDHRQRPGHDHQPRQDPAHRPRQAHRQQALRHPARQPVAEHTRHQSGDLGLGSAQPVALLVRHGQPGGRAVLRRRAAEQLRGGQPDRQGPEHGLAPHGGQAAASTTRSPTTTRPTATRAA